MGVPLAIISFIYLDKTQATLSVSLNYMGMVALGWCFEATPEEQKEKKEFQKLIFLTGIIYTITSILYMLAYIGETPIVITLLTKLQLFGVVIISVIRKTDKMNLKKVISLIVGILCIIGMTLLS